MKVRLQRNGILTAPIDVQDVDGVVVCTDVGTPVMIAKDMEGKVFAATALDKAYDNLLASVGCRKDCPVDFGGS